MQDFIGPGKGIGFYREWDRRYQLGCIRRQWVDIMRAVGEGTWDPVSY